MKFIHTGDLHIGKIVNGFSMLADQKYILKQMKEIAIEQKVDAFLIAGDIYDRGIPPAEAVNIFSEFLTELAGNGIKVFLISGNHDSPERISFAEDILEKQDVFIAGIYQGKLTQVTVADEYGEVAFVLMPFLKPQMIETATCGEAVQKMLSTVSQETALTRRVLMTHYFVTNDGKEPERSEDETTIHVGGLDNVEASLLGGFDYVALGHIHKSQQIGKLPIWYAGSPLKYSFSEVDQSKSVSVVTLSEKGTLLHERIPLTPLHEMCKIRGSLKELMENYPMLAKDRRDYIQAVLTDKAELIDPIGSLRSIYENIMQIVLEEKVGARDRTQDVAHRSKGKSMVEMFEEFYEIVKEEPLEEERKKIIETIVTEV